jgi:hypothetical protein
MPVLPPIPTPTPMPTPVWSPPQPQLPGLPTRPVPGRLTVIPVSILPEASPPGRDGTPHPHEPPVPVSTGGTDTVPLPVTVIPTPSLPDGEVEQPQSPGRPTPVPTPTETDVPAPVPEADVPPVAVTWLDCPPTCTVGWMLVVSVPPVAVLT